MKLRLRADTLRLRLSRSDVASFHAAGSLEAVTRFPGGARLSYLLKRGDAQDSGFSASFEGGVITVLLPAPLADEWSASDRVGLTGSVRLEDGSSFQVLVEKDFACLTEDRPEDRDAYPHPHPHRSC